MRRRTIWITAALAGVLLAASGAYTAIGMYYETHFFEHVKINGIDVSDLTAKEAERLIADQAEDYALTIHTKDGAQEKITGEQIGYRFVSGGEVQELLDEQNFMAWLPAYLGSGSEYTMEAAMTYEESLLVQAADGLACMQEQNITAPKDAALSQQEDGTYVIVPETEGNQLDGKKVHALLEDAVKNTKESIDFAEENCYIKPSVYADDGALKAEMAVRNKYAAMTITYQMGGGVTVTLGAEEIAPWFSLDENKQPVFDREAVAAWVNQLGDTYDTIGTYPPFVTSNGETVYVEARTYGWQLDREAETEALYQLLLAGETAERSPSYLESAWTRGENDIGNTYVEIDYTNQRMWYYKDGALLVETPVVTGNVSAGNASPEGIFCLYGKSEDETLVGETYRTPVEYWMPFYGGVGIHDADSWRTAYGGDIYQWSGSHGCINTPTAQAAIIYQNIEVGTPIICYSSATNYGYGQIGSSTGSASGSTDGSSSDIVITDGTQQNGSSGQMPEDNGTTQQTDASVDIEIIDEDWADESLYYDEDWADESLYDQDQIIY